MSDKKKSCSTCSHWEAHYTDMYKGDCHAPADHRYNKIPMPSGGFAMMDSFGAAETGPNYVCGAWKGGDPDILTIDEATFRRMSK